MRTELVLTKINLIATYRIPLQNGYLETKSTVLPAKGKNTGSGVGRYLRFFMIIQIYVDEYP